MVQPLIIDWDSNTPVANGTFIALLSSPWSSATILSASSGCAAGSFIANIQKNGVSVPGLNALVSVPGLSALGQGKATATGPTTLAPGDIITVVISGVTTSPAPTNAAVQINLQTSFN
jgi:hypothetical protein